MFDTGDAIRIVGPAAFAGAFSRTTVGNARPASGAGWEAYAIDRPRFTGPGRALLWENLRANLLLNSVAPATQSVTVTAQAYTLTFEGTGSVTLSGASTGTLAGTGANNRVSRTFTPTAGSLTLTVTGDVRLAQLEAGAFPTSWITTGGSAVTRASDVATFAPANGQRGTLLGTVTFPFLDAYQAPVLVSANGNIANGFWWRVNSAGTLVAQGAVGGAASQSAGAVASPAGHPLNFALAWDEVSAVLRVAGSAPLNFGGMVPAAGLNRVSVAGHSSFPTFLEMPRLDYYAARLPDAQLQAFAA
ncbi:hypothetical protein [Muricoccus roseus]|nr:hypothetical protein [Roseomonas rosea]